MLSLPKLLQITGYVLAFLLVARLLTLRLTRQFPFFCTYFYFVSARLIPMALISDKMTERFYNHLYWGTSNLGAALRLAIAWEVGRQLAPPNRPFASLFRRASAAILLALAILYYVWGPEGDVFSDLERKLSLASAFWLSCVFLAAVVWALPIRRPVWGMILGLGIYSSISLTNFSAFSLTRELQTTWGLIRQSSFSLMTLCFLWGFGSGEKIAALPTTAEAQLPAWKEQWARAESEVGRVGRD